MPVGAIAMLGKGNSSNRSMVMSHGVAVYIYIGEAGKEEENVASKRGNSRDLDGECVEAVQA